MPGTMPYPGSAERKPPSERSADTTPLSDKQWGVLHYMHEQDYAVSTRDMVDDLGYSDKKAAGKIIMPLWKHTVFVDRMEVRHKINGSGHVAHVYWLTDAGEAVVANA